MRRWAAALAAVVVLATTTLVGGAGPASAEDVTTAELRRLAGEAREDPAALDRLLGVDAVDGRPVDLAAALDGVRGDDLDARLAELAQPPAGTPAAGTAADERELAADILSGRRYHPIEAPKPFRGALEQLGEWLEPVLGPVGRLLADVLDALPAWVLALAALAGLVVLATRLGRRRVGAGGVGAVPAGGLEDELDPRLLDRAADAAEAAGRLHEAYRLRFRAGVLRLHRAGAIDDAPSRTTAALAEQLRSSRFAHLAHDFDEVAYGERSVSADDLAGVRAEWSAVLEEAGRR